MTTDTQKTTTTGGASVASKTLCLALTMSSIGNRKSVSTSQIEVDADKDMLKVSKQLMASPELVAITRADVEMRAILRAKALPSMFKSGIYLIPIPMVDDIIQLLTIYAKKRKKLINEFISVYTQRKAEAEAKLKELYNDSDYSSEEELRAAFVCTWNFVSYDTPARLKEISASYFESEKAKAEKMWIAAGEEIKLLLRAAMQELVAHMVDKLSPGVDGKKKIYRNTLVTNMTEFLGTFDMRNVTDDAQLRQLVQKAQALMAGVGSADDLRNDEKMRGKVLQGFEAIKQKLDGMMVSAGMRKIKLEE